MKPFRKGRISARDQRQAVANSLSLLDGGRNLEFTQRAIAAVGPKPQPRARKTSELPLERDVLRAILEALRAHPAVCFAWRLQSGMFQEGNRMVRVGFRGMPDICFMTKRGIFGAIEVKRPGGHPTPDQKAVLDLIWRGGGISGTCTSVDEAIALIP